MMATRTTSTRTTRRGSSSSADTYADGYSFGALTQAFLDCRRAKRNSKSAQAFEINQERNLLQLHDSIMDGTYYPGRSICFAVTRPKVREVWAAPFPDRIVHHLVYNHVAPIFYRKFIADSCACIPGRGTLYAAERLEHKIRSITQNWKVPAYYLKIDLANFFVSINKYVLHDQMAEEIKDPWWLALVDLILFHDPRENFEIRGNHANLALVPEHKRLTNQPWHLGLPIGNLPSQLGANIHLNALDQFVKHRLRCRHYSRYVDDCLLLSTSAAELNDWLRQINEYLPRLGVKLNPSKTIIQPIDRGVDFVGHVIKPHRRTTRRRVVRNAIKRIRAIPADQLMETANSYFGLIGQASHGHTDQARVARAVLQRGFTVNGDLTKTYRRKAA